MLTDDDVSKLIRINQVNQDPDALSTDPINMPPTELDVVDDRLCAAMRYAVEEGATLQELADRHSIAKSTVHYHVSSSSKGCKHDEVTIPQYEY